MPRQIHGKLVCDFPQGWTASKYDEWAFYRNQFQNCCAGNKAMDSLAFEPQKKTLWLIEWKDYRRNPRTKEISLWDEVAIKARDTLAGLFAARVELGHNDFAFARLAGTAAKLRVVLHLEQPATHTKLFPRTYDLAVVQQKLKQLVRPIDAHPCVVDLGHMTRVPWQASAIT